MKNLKNPFRRTTMGSGFTLVELQVSLVIVGLITLLMTSALRSTVQVWEKSSTRQDQAEHRFLVDQFLRRHLGNMRFYRFPLENEGGYLSFIGERKAMYFVAPFPAPENNGMLYWWTLRNQWNEALDHNEVVLEYMPYSRNMEVSYRAGRGIEIEDIESRQFVVDDNLEIEELRYFRVDRDGINTWEDNWEPDLDAPVVVEVRLRSTRQDARRGETTRIGVAPKYTALQLLFQGQSPNG